MPHLLLLPLLLLLFPPLSLPPPLQLPSEGVDKGDIILPRRGGLEEMETGGSGTSGGG